MSVVALKTAGRPSSACYVMCLFLLTPHFLLTPTFSTTSQSMPLLQLLQLFIMVCALAVCCCAASGEDKVELQADFTKLREEEKELQGMIRELENPEEARVQPPTPVRLSATRTHPKPPSGAAPAASGAAPAASGVECGVECSTSSQWCGVQHQQPVVWGAASGVECGGIHAFYVPGTQYP
ncbi:hypothetical protein V8C86DRAFT_1502829 [Haematococcus lacustris]